MSVDQGPVQQPSRSSSRVEPFWLNPATISGADDPPDVADLGDALSQSFRTDATVRIEYIPSVVVTYPASDGREDGG